MIMKTVIRPETEMKDSGIEWIGNIPNDWKYRELEIFSHSVVVIRLQMKILEMMGCILCMVQMV